MKASKAQLVDGERPTETALRLAGGGQGQSNARQQKHQGEPHIHVLPSRKGHFPRVVCTAEDRAELTFYSNS